MFKSIKNQRFLALLLVFCLLPILPFSVLAEEKPRTNLFGSTLSDKQDNLTSIAKVGDTLYLLTDSDLYTYAPGDAAPLLRASFERPLYNYGIQVEEEQKPQANVLLSDGNSLYTLDTNAQTLYLLSIKDGQLAFEQGLKLDLSDFVSGEAPQQYTSTPESYFIFDGRVYLKKNNYEGLPVDLFSFDLKTGEKKEHQVPHLVRTTPYKDGLMLAVQMDMGNLYDPETGKMRLPQVFIFNPMDDSLTETGLLLPVAGDNAGDAMGNLYYDQAEDSLYFHTLEGVFRFDEGFKTQRKIGYLPFLGSYTSAINNGLIPMPDGRLAISYVQGVFFRERTEKGLEGVSVLSLANGLDDPRPLTRALMEMDNLTLQRVEGLDVNYIGAQQLASMFLTQSVNVDMMSMNAYSFDMDKLIEKGYLADLSESAIIKDYATSIQPNLSQAYLKDGKVYAIPVSLLVFPTVAYVQPFEDLGIPLPTSVRGFIDLARKWAEDLAEKHPDYKLFNNGSNYRRDLTQLVLDSYINAAFGTGEDLVFDTPLFRELMNEVASIDFGDLDLEIDWSTPEGRAMGEEMMEKKGLIETNMGFEVYYVASSYNQGEYRNKALILPLEEGGTGYQQADFTMMVVLSTTKEKDMAVRLLEEFVGKINPEAKASLEAGRTEPLMNPNYEETLRRNKLQIAHMEKLLGIAQGAQKSNLEKQFKDSLSYYKNFEETGMYLINAEGLKAVQEVVDRLYVMTGLMNAQRNAMFDDNNLVSQYTSGAITLDAFIKQMDEKLRLVRMEYQ